METSRMRPPSSARDTVLKTLKDSLQPLSIDAVRYRANIKSWNTARAILLELLAEGKIQGMKSSKSWVFWFE